MWLRASCAVHFDCDSSTVSCLRAIGDLPLFLEISASTLKSSSPSFISAPVTSTEKTRPLQMAVSFKGNSPAASQKVAGIVDDL